ncbi:Importin N-terminal domain-containing protein [Meloidogyne graminicola]|uniref:Importin N-terminal domain-containing protein n=1 Tax=Meloidogyne graminicola TaxID=189291 RepID=A0A8S9ZW04_9BILA|nr:Importin N-terminal domain-containing protein [Meloidogyne graminicola]
MELDFLRQAQYKLLEGGEKFDVPALDKVVGLMNNTTGEAQKAASDLLARFKENPDSWTKVDAILELSALLETKYFGLQILEQLIQTRWKALPREQCEGIKGYIVNMILEISSDAEKSERMKLLLHKLNLVLVQIVKQEWPRLWPSFISDIVGSSRNGQSLCMNNMAILRLLSEEVFDFGTGLTSARAVQLKQQFCGQFEEVFMLCYEILENSDNAQLVYATLSTLHGFLDWIPVGYVFENNLIDLILKFLPFPAFRSISVQCLVEISSISTDDNPQYGSRLVHLLKTVMKTISEQLPLTVDIADSYAKGRNEDQKFISDFAQLLGTFLKEHSNLVEVLDLHPTPEQLEVKQAHELALKYLLKIGQVEDVEVFKICLDYWNWLTMELFRESPFEQSEHPLMDTLRRYNRSESPRRKLYSEVLSELRVLMISRMAKPEEVIIVLNENNEAVRELVKDTDSMMLYKTMRETLVLLTHLDYRDTELKMTEKLQNQVNGTEWSWKNLNTLCWAIGSISSSMHEDDEKRFLVTVIRDLLGLCEQKRGKDNKAVIASNIMYVVGQYPRFLRCHWKFLKTVINKLFEFMHESHEGVQDMACDTFIKIVIKCKLHFVVIQTGESQPFIEEILQNLNNIICDLSQPQVHVFFEAIGHIIYAASSSQVQERLIEKLMALPNSIWTEAIEAASKDVSIFTDPEVLKNLTHILKTNVAACKSIGAPFFSQLKRILNDMLSIYQVISGNLNKAVNEQGEHVLKWPLIKHMRVVKKEILTLLSTWISRAFEGRIIEEALLPIPLVIENIINPLFSTVLRDYEMNVPQAREPKVLSLLSITIVSLKEEASSQVPAILDAVFTCTLDMINKDMEAFPEHRTNFFQLLKAINTHCFNVLIALPDKVLSLIIQAIVWAIKHTMRNVAENGIEILRDLLGKVASMTDRAQARIFYQKHFMTIMEHVLGVLTDNNQVQFVGLTNLAETVCILFQAAENTIDVPLNPSNPLQANTEYVYETITSLFVNHFKNLTEAQIAVTVKGFISYNRILNKMREHIRDFLVQIREEAGDDTADLFLEEKEAEIQRIQAEKQAIPGVRNPNELVEEDMA